MNFMGIFNLIIRLAFASLFVWSLLVGVPQVVLTPFVDVVRDFSTTLFYIMSISLMIALVYGSYKMFIKGSYFFTIFAIYFLVTFSDVFLRSLAWNYPYFVSIAMSWMQNIFGVLLVVWGIVEYFLANKI